MKSKWKSEAEFAEILIEHLRLDGWTIYPEIMDIDIIATKPSEEYTNKLKVIGIETKLNMNLAVLHQAYRNAPYVNETYICTPRTAHKNFYFGIKVAKSMNIGVYSISSYTHDIIRNVKPEPVELSQDLVVKSLHPAAINFAKAGSNKQKTWSLFKKMNFELLEYVAQHEGCTIKEAAENISNHCTSKKGQIQSIKKAFKFNYIEGLTLIDKKIYVNK